VEVLVGNKQVGDKQMKSRRIMHDRGNSRETLTADRLRQST